MALSASTASHPAFVTTAKRPSVERDGDSFRSDLGQTRSGIFLQMGLDRFLPDGQISCGGSGRIRPPITASSLCLTELNGSSDIVSKAHAGTPRIAVDQETNHVTARVMA